MYTWKIIFVECRPVGGQWGVHRDPNAIAAQCGGLFFFRHFKLPQDAEGRKVRRQDILR